MAVYLIESKLDQQKLVDHVGEETAKLFFTMKDRLKNPENDIYYWLKREPFELEDRLANLQNIKTRSQKDIEASQGAELIYNQDGWKVYHITTYAASAKYGKGTKWCITGSKVWDNGEKGEYYFNQYTGAGIEFYFYIKDGTEKYALSWYPEYDKFQVFNAEDKDITNEDLSFLPNVDGLPKFNYDDVLNEDGTFIYKGEKEISEIIKQKIITVVVQDEVDSIEPYVFFDCNNIQEVILSDSVTVIDNYAFAGCRSLETIKFSNGLRHIRASSFSACKSLKYIDLPEGLESIGIGAFAYCGSLESIIIPNSVKRLGPEVFTYCTGLKFVNLSNGSSKISPDMFWNCFSLTSISIPASISEILDSAFYGCQSLQTVRYGGTQEMWSKIYIQDGNRSLVDAPDIVFNS